MTARRLCLTIGAALLLVGADDGAAQDKTQDRTQSQDRTQTKDPATHTGTTSPDPDRLRTRDQLKDVLRSDGKLSEKEIESTSADLDGYLKRGGTQEQFRAMVRSSIGEGCKGVCLAEAVRSMNQLMERGQSGAQAASALQAMLRQQNQERQQKQLAQGDGQAQERLREQTRERTREMDRERTREQSRERASTPGPTGGSTGGASQGGKGGGK
jgi:hypothetical protein